MVLTGQSLRYVVELEGQWLALLVFSAASSDQAAKTGLSGLDLCLGLAIFALFRSP
jgi:hypothetical protein